MNVFINGSRERWPNVIIDQATAARDAGLANRAEPVNEVWALIENGRIPIVAPIRTASWAEVCGCKGCDL